MDRNRWSTAETATLPTRMQAAYDRIAPSFAERNAEMPDDLADSARAMRVALDGGALLDVGCGAGRDMAWFEAHDLPVVGVDLSQGMLAQARTIVRGPLAQMDMCQLGFSSGLFQGVWCCAALLHLPKQVAPVALAEIGRVLVADGLLMVAVQAGATEAWEKGAFAGVERFFARYQEGEMVELLEAAGFQIKSRSSNQAGARTWLRFFCQRR